MDLFRLSKRHTLAVNPVVEGWEILLVSTFIFRGDYRVDSSFMRLEAIMETGVLSTPGNRAQQMSYAIL